MNAAGSFDQFRQLVLGDTSLQERLRRETDRDRFIELVTRIGAEAGYLFTRDDVVDEMRLARLTWLERGI